MHISRKYLECNNKFFLIESSHGGARACLCWAGPGSGLGRPGVLGQRGGGQGVRGKGWLNTLSPSSCVTRPCLATQQGTPMPGEAGSRERPPRPGSAAGETNPCRARRRQQTSSSLVKQTCSVRCSVLPLTSPSSLLLSFASP